jgi:thiol-disulfide isomerase/thioredoxin
MKAKVIVYVALVGGLLTLLGFAVALQSYTNARPQASGANGVTFVFTDLNGNTVNITDFRGKVVLLDAMASWCIPCFEENQHLQTIAQLYPNQVQVISMTVDPTDTVSSLQQYVASHNVTWPMFQFNPTVVASIHSTALPSLIVYDRQGVQRDRFSGLTDVATMQAAVEDVLNSY